MKLPRPALRLASVGLVAGLLAAGCSHSSGSRNAAAVRSNGSVDLTKVTLVVGDQKGGSQALLRSAGQLDDVPYTIQWKTFTSGPPLLEAVTSGAVDVGGVGNTPPIFAAAGGGEIKVVSVNRASLAGEAILVPRVSSIRSVSDLEGATIAVAPGSSGHYLLLAALTKAGLTPDDVKIQELQPSDALAAFQQGHLDAWSIWDPYTAQAEIDADARVLTTGEHLTNGLKFQTSSQQALDDPATVAALRDYLGRLRTAELWSGTHEGRWAQVWADETGLPLKVTQLAASRRQITPIVLDDSVSASEQQIADAFSDADVIPENITFSDIVDGRFNTTLAQVERQHEKEQR